MKGSTILRWVAMPILYAMVFFITVIVLRFIDPADHSSLVRLAREGVVGKWLLGLFEVFPCSLIATMGGIYVSTSIIKDKKQLATIILSTIVSVVYVVLIVIQFYGNVKGITSYEETISGYCQNIGVVIGAIICLIYNSKNIECR